MSDLETIVNNFYHNYGLKFRVATKYKNLTRLFFQNNNIIDYKIIDSLGATEGFPAAGSSEMIVDITSTGKTLDANNLRILKDGIILKSEAAVFAAPDQEAHHIELILSRLEKLIN